MKTGDICRGPPRLSWPLLSSVAKAGGSPAEQAAGKRGGSGFMAATGSPWPSLLLTTSEMTQLCWFLGGVKPKQNMCVVPQKAGRLVSHPSLPFPKRGTLSGGSALQVRAGLAWGWTRQAHEAGLPPPSLWLFPGVLSHCVAGSVLSGLQGSPGGANCRSLWGQRLGSPTSPPQSFWGFRLCIRKNWGWERKEIFFFLMMYFEMTRILSLLKCQT